MGWVRVWSDLGGGGLTDSQARADNETVYNDGSALLGHRLELGFSLSVRGKVSAEESGVN